MAPHADVLSKNSNCEGIAEKGFSSVSRCCKAFRMRRWRFNEDGVLKSRLARERSFSAPAAFTVTEACGVIGLRTFC